MTCNSGVYCILSEDGMTISKIGSTKNFQKRYQFYREQWDIEEWQFFIMVDFSNTNERVDQRMNELYTAMIQALIEADKLDPFQKYLFHTLMERGGDRLGPKETSWLQMIEIGLQHEFGLPAVSDFVMYDPRVAQGLYNTANTQAIHLMQHLSVLSSKVQNDETVPLQALSSWMSGIKYLSSNVVTSKCILGEQFQDQYVDTLPFPPVANPTTVDEMFDTSKYTDQDKENGRTVLFQTLTDFLKTSCGVLFMDTNKLILDDDHNCRISAHTILTEDFQLIYTERFLEGEIVLYLDERQFHAVLLHKPVCVASDSRRFISDSLRWKRGLAVSTLCSVGRLVRGEPVLSPNVRFCNPIHAMLAFHIIVHGYHLGHRQAAAFYRDFVTPESTNAVLDNGLPKSAENDPVAERLRRKYIQASGRIFVDKMDHGEKVRRQDCSIISQGRSITSQAHIESTDWDVVMQLKTLFRANPSLQSANFRHFVQNHLSDHLSKQLLEVYETTTANAGNKTMGPNKAATRVKVNFNDGSVAQLLQTHAPQNGELQGERFWIKETQNVVAHPANGSISTDPSISFPNDKIIYDDLCYDGLRERFKSRVRQNSGHDAVKAIRYEQFVLKKCTKKNIGCRNPYTISCGGYVLVYIEARASKKEGPESDTTVASRTAVPLEQHCTQRSKIPHWTRAKECVLCIVKAEEQYPDWNRKKMRQEQILTQSRWGCPQCNNGKGVPVCNDCWDEFDHQQYML